jgi:threonine synthase
MFDLPNLAGRAANLWRYQESLGINDSKNYVSFGEGPTPLTPYQLNGREVLLKLDYLRPTGSFKDRGTAVMISKLKEWGVAEVIDDSSGNAGASVAAYAAAAGIRAEIFIPAYTSLGKATQIRAYGATLIKIHGGREDTAEAAWAAAARSFYASHNWSPYFLAGMKTMAYEIAEQLNWKAPDWVVVPVGGGSLIVGLWQGFLDLRACGYVTKMPRLVAVQSENCAPIYEAWKAGRQSVHCVQKRQTAAEGIAISDPIRAKQILQAIQNSAGISHIVSDDEVWYSLKLLASKGVYIEPTSAAAIGACSTLLSSGVIGHRDIVVIPLTGFGLKATDKIVEHCSDTWREPEK